MSDERLSALSREADAAYARGAMEFSLDLYLRLRARAEADGDAAVVDFARVHVGICLWHLGRVEEALSETGAVLRLLDESADARFATGYHALVRWLWIALHHGGRLERVREMIRLGHRALEDRGRRRWAAPLHYTESVLERYRGCLSEAAELADRAVAAAREDASGPGYVLSEYLRAAARARLDAGVNDDLVRAYGRELATPGGPQVLFVCAARGHEILSRSAALDGDLDAALAHARRVEELYRGTAYPAGRIEAHVCLADAHRVRGEGVQAIAAAREAVREAADYASDLWRFDAARAALDAGMPGAEELARAVAARIDGRFETTRNTERVRRIVETQIG